MDLGTRIRELRETSGLTQEAVAERLGLSRQAVAKWEAGRSLPSTANLCALCRLFDVPLDALLPHAEVPKKSFWENSVLRSVLVCLSILCVLAAVAVFLSYGEIQVPADAIGYANASTQLYVSGPPVLLYVLCVAAVVLAAMAVFAFLHGRSQRKGDKK